MAEDKTKEPSPFLVKLTQKRLRDSESRRTDAARDLLAKVRKIFEALPITLKPLETVVLGEIAREMGRWGVGENRPNDKEIVAKAVMKAHNLLETIREELLNELERK